MDGIKKEKERERVGTGGQGARKSETNISEDIDNIMREQGEDLSGRGGVKVTIGIRRELKDIKSEGERERRGKISIKERTRVINSGRGLSCAA